MVLPRDKSSALCLIILKPCIDKLVHRLSSVFEPMINCPLPVYDLWLPDSNIPILEGMFSSIINLFQACFLFLVLLACDTWRFTELYLQLLFFRGLENTCINLLVWCTVKSLSRITKLSICVPSITTWEYVFIFLQGICPAGYADAHESLSYVKVAGKTYQQQEAILG